MVDISIILSRNKVVNEILCFIIIHWEVAKYGTQVVAMVRNAGALFKEEGILLTLPLLLLLPPPLPPPPPPPLPLLLHLLLSLLSSECPGSSLAF